MPSRYADPREIGLVSLSVWQRIDEICMSFERALQQDESPRIEDRLVNWHGCEREALLRELLSIEVEYDEREGNAAHEADYRLRFPGSGDVVELVLHEARNATPHVGEQASQETLAHHESTTLVPAIGTFGDYELLEEIARGGMGVVFKARQLSLNRIVAVKMILAGQLASNDDVKRFHSEARAAAQLDHPCIVPVFDVGEVAGQHFFSMGYIDGPSLAEQIAVGPLVPVRAAEVMLQVAEAVKYAHEMGVIHRDLKPGNILLDRDRRARITDFGLARHISGAGLTVTGQLVGTPSYMAPEQASGDPGLISPAMDVYALGATLYALLSGHPPFQAASLLDTLKLVQEQDPVPLRQLDATIPRDLETITLKCLEKRPDRRYPTACALAEELDRFLTHKPILARPVGQIERMGRWCWRNPVLAVLSATAVSLLIAVAFISTLAYYREADLRTEAETERNKKGAALIAETAAREAETAAKLSERQQREAAERLTRSANAQRLAAQANDGLTEHPRRSLLLAVEAAQTTLRAREPRLPEAEDALRRALATIGGKNLSDRGSPLRTLATSPDGRWLATMNKRTIVQIWDLTLPDPAAKPFTLRDPVRLHDQLGANLAAAFSADGRWFALDVYPTSVHVWDLASADPNENAIVLRGHSHSVISLAFSADNRWIVTGSNDETTRVWDLTAPKPGSNSLVLPKSLNEYGVNTALAISPDGHWLATANRSARARLWDLTAATPADSAVVLAGHTDFVWDVAISPDGHWLVTGSQDFTARLWDLTVAKPYESSVVLQLRGSVTKLEISSDSHWLATAAADKTVQIWDLTANDVAAKPVALRGHENLILTMAFSRDGRRLVAGGSDNTARLWDLSAAEPSSTARVFRGHDAMVDKVALSANRKWLVTGSNDFSTRIWSNSVDNDASVRVLRGHENKIDHLEISPDGHWLVTESRDKRAALWDLTAIDPTPFFLPLTDDKVNHSTCALAFSRDGRWLATAWGKTAKLWDLRAAAPGALRAVFSGEARSALVAFSPDGHWLVTAGDNQTCIWNLMAVDPAAQAVTLRGDQAVKALTISPDGHWLITGLADGTARMWDLTAADPSHDAIVLKGRRGARHRSAILAMTITADGRWLVSGSHDKTARLWDLKSPDPSDNSVVLEGHKGFVSTLATSRDSHWLVTGSTDHTARIWDLSAPDPSETSVALRGHDTTVNSVAISPDAHWVITGGGKTARIWDLTAVDPGAKPVTLRGHDDVVSAVAITPDGHRLATGSWDYTARLWTLRLEELIEQARQAAGRELTDEECEQYGISR